MPSPATLEGIALHAGIVTSVSFSPHEGPLVLEQDGARCALQDLIVSRADAGVAVASPDGRLRIDLVEHVMAAIGGLGLTRGIRVVVRGPEPPLIDGGAAAFVRALRQVTAPARAPVRRIARAARLEVGSSIYDISPDARTALGVAVDFAHPLVRVGEALWDGTPDDFEQSIAPARTFGFFSDWGALKAAGRALGANARDVVILCDDGSTLTEPPPAPDECARHKLLDLVGDLTLCGGVPRGRLRAIRPGHRANIEAFRRFEAMGAIAPA